MAGPMPNDELQSHRRIIVDFLASWGYHLAPGAILPAEFKHSYGLRIEMGKAMTISDHPGRDGQTSEYFLRDCLETAHLNLWRSLREIAIDQDSKTPNADLLRHSDGNVIARWAATLLMDDTKPFSGKFEEEPNALYVEERCFEGTVSGANMTMRIDNRLIKLKTVLPATVLQSIRMNKVREIFEGIPPCSNNDINEELLDSYIMSAKQNGQYVEFDLLSSKRLPMPAANLNDLWRRVRALRPDTVMLQFPPYVGPEETLAKAAEHRIKLEELLSELKDNEVEYYQLYPQKAAA